jgi:hypothetical protein
MDHRTRPVTLTPVLAPRRRRRPLVAILAVVGALVFPASALADWGSIAVNLSTVEFGVGYNYPTKHKAKARAQRECPGDCKIVVIVYNLCGASVRTDTHLYSAVAKTKQEAYKEASRKAPGHSTHVAWVCSG